MDLGAEIDAVRRRVQAGECDLRDIGLLLNGKWDQDFPAALLDAARTETAQERPISTEINVNEHGTYGDSETNKPA